MTLAVQRVMAEQSPYPIFSGIAFMNVYRETAHSQLSETFRIFKQTLFYKKILV
jgi:hypothetical protein